MEGDDESLSRPGQLPQQLASEQMFECSWEPPPLTITLTCAHNLLAIIAGGGLAARTNASTALPPCSSGCTWLRAQTPLHWEMTFTVFAVR